MRFSKKSEYGLRAMIELTYSFGRGVVQRRRLSEKQGIPLGFLEVILLQLKNSGLIGSKRGANGGVFLIKSPKEVTLGKIIRILDGPLAPIGCVSQTAYQKCEDCPYAKNQTCPIQGIMMDVRNAISSILDHFSLEDFVYAPKSAGTPGHLPSPQSSSTPSKRVAGRAGNTQNDKPISSM